MKLTGMKYVIMITLWRLIVASFCEAVILTKEENASKNLWDFIRGFQLFALEKGGICEFWFGPHSFYAITDPEDSLRVSNTCLSKPYIYDFSNDFVKNGLVTAEISVWKIHRKLLNPAFNQQVLNTYLNEINAQAKILDVRHYLVNYILTTVTRTSLKVTAEDQVVINTDYAETIDDLLAIYCDRSRKVWLHLSCLFKWSALKRRENQLTDKLKNIMRPIIQKRKSELKAIKNANIYHESTSTSGKFEPVLDKMLKLAEEQDAFTDDDIQEHLDTLVAASYDTTSSAMIFILLVVGKYHDVQERIFNELQEVHKHEDADFTKEDLQKLVYLEAVIKECMRLYPSVPFIARKVDVEINLKNCTLRAGSSCALGIYGLLRHPLWGADAEQFRPERWLDPASLPVHPGLYAAFSVGKRNCIGKLFGMVMMKMALAHIFRRYRVTGDINNIVCEYDVILKPVKGHHIGLTSRS